MIDFSGAPGRIRTSGPQIRSLVLYPAELRARLKHWKAAGNSRRLAIAIGSIPTWQGSIRLHASASAGVATRMLPSNQPWWQRTALGAVAAVILRLCGAPHDRVRFSVPRRFLAPHDLGLPSLP